jgi:uncharacterized membrane protein
MSASKLDKIYPPIIKLVVSFIILGVINAVLVRLPGVDIIIPGLPIMMPDIISAVIGILMVGVMVKFGYEIYLTIKNILPSFPEVAIIVLNLAYIGAIGIAYVYFAGITYPFLRGVRWVYSLLFLAISILPAVNIARALLGSIDRWSTLITKGVKEMIKEGTPPQEGTPKFTTEPFDIVSEYQKTVNMLESLNERMAKGEISESVYEKIRGDIIIRQREIIEKAKNRIKELEDETSGLQEKKKSFTLELEELKARYATGMIQKSEYEYRKGSIERELEMLERQINTKQEEIQKLKIVVSKLTAS